MSTLAGGPGDRHDVGSPLEIAPGITWESRLAVAPVDYAGTIDGDAYYFRARGSRWMLTIAASPELAVDAQLARDALECAYFAAEGRYHGVDEDLHTGFAASWMPLEQAEAIIRGAAAAWRAARDVRPRRDPAAAPRWSGHRRHRLAGVCSSPASTLAGLVARRMQHPWAMWESAQ